MRVLIVEDEPHIATYIKRGLEENGYAVDTAATGREALEWATAVAFDLIVLDVLLPEGDGISVCRTLRAGRLRTPILMLTARDGVDDRVAGLDAGADDYLVKPFAIKELLARLRALLRRGGFRRHGHMGRRWGERRRRRHLAPNLTTLPSRFFAEGYATSHWDPTAPAPKAAASPRATKREYTHNQTHVPLVIGQGQSSCLRLTIDT